MEKKAYSLFLDKEIYAGIIFATDIIIKTNNHNFKEIIIKNNEDDVYYKMCKDVEISKDKDNSNLTMKVYCVNIITL